MDENMSLLGASYTERTWKRYPFVAFKDAQKKDSPDVTHDGVPNFFNSNSEKSIEFANLLSRVSKEQRTAMTSRAFIWDWELLAADALDLENAGGSLDILTQEWNGHTPGSLVLMAYGTDENGNIGSTLLVEDSTEWLTD